MLGSLQGTKTAFREGHRLKLGPDERHKKTAEGLLYRSKHVNQKVKDPFVYPRKVWLMPMMARKSVGARSDEQDEQHHLQSGIL